MLNFNWIADLPLGWAKFIVILAFVAPWIFAMTLKQTYLYQGASDTARWRNLKVWVTVIVVIQIAIYLYF